MPIYLSSTGRLLADPPTPAALALLARVEPLLAVVRPPLTQQPGGAYPPPRALPPRLTLSQVARHWARDHRQPPDPPTPQETP